MTILATRGVTVALLVMLLALVALAPTRARLRGLTIACVAVALSLGVGALVSKVHPVSVASPLMPETVAAEPNFIADDAGTHVLGGTPVSGDAAYGRISRELQRTQPYSIPVLTHLQPGETYTILFSVKPLSPVVTSGGVGDPGGKGWQVQGWTAAPVVGWQRFRKFLRATAQNESLAIYTATGSARVRFDGVQIRKGRLAGPSGDFAPQQPIAQPSFVADDLESAAKGGRIVTSDARFGVFSRRLQPSQALAISALRGLVPRTSYTVVAWIKPLGASPVSGTVGDPTKRGWGTVRWRVIGADRWQPVKVTLTARRHTARLSLVGRRGSPPFLVDGLRVLKGPATIPAPTRPVIAAKTPGSVFQAAGQATPKSEGKASSADSGTLVGAVRNTFDAGSVSGENANVRWRLAYWKALVTRTSHHPFFGVGFGIPAHFRWHGVLYDARTGDSRDPNDVTPPHNSFINILYRTGLLGLLPCLILIGIGMIRTARLLPRLHRARERADVVGLLCLFVFVLVVANLNVALEGPYMGMFFWSLLALLFIVPRLLTDSAAPHVPEAVLGPTTSPSSP